MRSIGMFFGFGAGLRVGGELTFVPAHLSATTGKKISHRVDIPVYCNSHRGNNGEGKSSLFKVTAWGDLARKLAISCSPGKALDVVVELSAYKGRVWHNQVLVTDTAGQPITVTKTSMTIMRIIFGEETQKHIDDQVATNARPMGWNNPASPDFQLWKNMLQQKMALQYTGGDKFEFARVLQPNGQILPPEQASGAVAAPAAVAAVAPVAGVVAPAAVPVQAVTQAFTPQPGVPVAGVPVAAPAAAFAAPGAIPGV